MTLSAWFAVILEAAGLPPTQAALVFSCRQSAASFAILILDRLIDQFGPKATVLTAVIAVSAIISRHTRPIACADHAVAIGVWLAPRRRINR
jgi:MFS family permease